MKAAIIKSVGTSPVYGEFNEPQSHEGCEIVSVRASALSQFSKSRSSGSHYTSDSQYPNVAGADGVGTTDTGELVYFVLPKAPYGALAEKCLVRSSHCIKVPKGIDYLTAAAIANPGMSSWAALVERAHLQAGETVLINGSTGTAGILAVQIAKYLGAGKVIATGRNEVELNQLLQIGADVVIRFSLDDPGQDGAEVFEQALIAEFSTGIDVVIDYLWGESARAIIIAIARAAEDEKPVRFVQVGTAGGQENIELPGAALRSSAIQLMGSGVKSVAFSKLLECIKNVFDAVGPAKLQIATQPTPLSTVEKIWESVQGKPRIVFKIKE